MMQVERADRVHKVIQANRRAKGVTLASVVVMGGMAVLYLAVALATGSIESGTDNALLGMLAMGMGMCAAVAIAGLVVSFALDEATRKLLKNHDMAAFQELLL